MLNSGRAAMFSPALLLAALIFVAGCEADELRDGNLDNIHGEEGKSWYLASRESLVDTITLSVAECERDDRFAFLPNRAVKRVKNDNLCSPDETDDVGVWELDYRYQQTFLEITINNGTPREYVVEDLTSRRMVLLGDSVRVAYTTSPNE